MIEKIVIIGAGSVATHLSKALKNAGKKVIQVYSRTSSPANSLAKLLDCDYTTDIKNIMPEADLYIVSVTDSAISKVIKSFTLENVLVAHTSGSISIDALRCKNVRPAVFYPMQTFSKDVDLDFGEIPVFLEAINKDDLDSLHDLAKCITSNVYTIDSQQRLLLHIAAVFACNYTNYMFAIAEDLLKQNNMDFNILKPLISETVRKAGITSPEKAQTGPAVRNDKTILDLHSNTLSSINKYQDIYNFISESIIANFAQKSKKD